jgi:tRNA nucleotidyltransferase/poly(A) polymerase
MYKDHSSDDLLSKFRTWETPLFPINGQDLKAEGVPPGKGIGFCLNHLKEKWIEEDFKPDQESLLKIELPKAVDAYTELSPSRSSGKKANK